jgi:hypothetical protein
MEPATSCVVGEYFHHYATSAVIIYLVSARLVHFGGVQALVEIIDGYQRSLGVLSEQLIRRASIELFLAI